MAGKNWQLSIIKKHLHNQWLMLYQRCSNVVPMSCQCCTTMLSQRQKLRSPQLSFLTLSQRCDNVNHDVVTTLSCQLGGPLITRAFKALGTWALEHSKILGSWRALGHLGIWKLLALGHLGIQGTRDTLFSRYLIYSRWIC